MNPIILFAEAMNWPEAVTLCVMALAMAAMVWSVNRNDK